MGIFDQIARHRDRFHPVGVHYSGLAAYVASASLLWLSPAAAVVPLTIFIVLCMIAPFMPAWNFYLSNHAAAPRKKGAVAITFDDGPDPELTPLILKKLKSHSISATFFVTGKNAIEYPHIIKMIVQEGHTIGNHSFNHDPFLMLKRSETIRREILSCQEVLYEKGIHSRVFRPPAGITNPKLAKVLDELKMSCVTFSCRAGDRGNRNIRHLSQKILRRIRAGQVVLLHDTKRRFFSANEYLQQLDDIIKGIISKGLCIIPLNTLLDKPVMDLNDNFFT